MSTFVIPLNAFFEKKPLWEELSNALSIIGESKADGVEIRRELLTDNCIPTELQLINAHLQSKPLFAIYSAPIPLWNEDGYLNTIELSSIFKESDIISAKMVKLPLGHYHQTKSNMKLLGDFLQEHPSISLVIENDQTVSGGKIRPLLQFFKSVFSNDIPIRMTFDMGNWAFLQEDAIKAFSLFHSHIEYVHIKQVQPSNGNLQTLPIDCDKNELWKLINTYLSPSILKGLEFPINLSIQSINNQIDILSKQRWERTYAIN
ncbi:MAG TPA: sugar phosphate isomerase/epimerase [Niallia sp.]|nr:sugar phosphate isomerase/epimerase [Niallia sp.]